MTPVAHETPPGSTFTALPLMFQFKFAAEATPAAKTTATAVIIVFFIVMFLSLFIKAASKPAW